MSKQKRGRLRGEPPELRVTEIVDNTEVEKVISDVSYCRILGANLKNNQSWEAHLTTGKKAILPAVRRQLGALQSLRHVLSRKAKLQLVNSLILSRPNLCNQPLGEHNIESENEGSGRPEQSGTFYIG